MSVAGKTCAMIIELPEPPIYPTDAELGRDERAIGINRTQRAFSLVTIRYFKTLTGVSRSLRLILLKCNFVFAFERAQYV